MTMTTGETQTSGEFLIEQHDKYSKGIISKEEWHTSVTEYLRRRKLEPLPHDVHKNHVRYPACPDCRCYKESEGTILDRQEMSEARYECESCDWFSSDMKGSELYVALPLVETGDSPTPDDCPPDIDADDADFWRQMGQRLVEIADEADCTRINRVGWAQGVLDWWCGVLRVRELPPEITKIDKRELRCTSCRSRRIHVVDPVEFQKRELLREENLKAHREMIAKERHFYAKGTNNGND
jgi:hypothetical protein